MKQKTKIASLVLVLIFPLSCSASFLPEIKIDTEKIVWTATCQAVQTKAKEKKDHLKNLVSREDESVVLIWVKLINILRELESRGYPIEDFKRTADGISIHIGDSSNNVYDATNILNDIEKNACQKDKTWTKNRLAEAKHSLSDARDHYLQFKYSYLALFESLSNLRNNRVEARR